MAKAAAHASDRTSAAYHAVIAGKAGQRDRQVARPSKTAEEKAVWERKVQEHVAASRAAREIKHTSPEVRLSDAQQLMPKTEVKYQLRRWQQLSQRPGQQLRLRQLLQSR